MGRIGTLVKSEISKFIQLVVETFSGYNQTADQYGSSGEDSPPLKDDRIVLVKVDGTGKYVAVGVLTVSQGSKPGEKIFYARDPDAKIVSKIAMLNDGSVSVEADGDINAATKGNATLKTDGDVSVEIGGGKTEKITGDYALESANAEIKAQAAKITGGTLEVKGSVIPTGDGPFCAVKNCYFCAAPVSGSKVSGT